MSKVCFLVFVCNTEEYWPDNGQIVDSPSACCLLQGIVSLGQSTSIARRSPWRTCLVIGKSWRALGKVASPCRHSSSGATGMLHWRHRWPRFPVRCARAKSPSSMSRGPATGFRWTALISSTSTSGLFWLRNDRTVLWNELLQKSVLSLCQKRKEKRKQKNSSLTWEVRTQNFSFV